MEYCHNHEPPPPPDTATATVTGHFPCSTLGPELSDAFYFYSCDIHSNMLTDFAWIGEGQGNLRLPENNNNQSLSSNSGGEDPAEISIPSERKKLQTPNISKKKQKRMKQARFAFMTKSETDNLEDGYRWRKYGQKAVKNSPFPRSYYRCTNSKCSVKKRVERSSADPGVVITTYEGQHCHHSTVSSGGVMISTHEAEPIFGTHHDHSCCSSSPRTRILMSSHLYHPIHQLSPGGADQEHYTHYISSTVSHQPCQLIQALLPDSTITDDGLLEDILPRNIYNNGI